MTNRLHDDRDAHRTGFALELPAGDVVMVGPGQVPMHDMHSEDP